MLLQLLAVLNIGETLSTYRWSIYWRASALMDMLLGHHLTGEDTAYLWH